MAKSELSSQLERENGHRSKLRAVGIIDKLVGEDLHGLAACPSDMRCDDEIRQPQIEQNIALLGRIDRQHVETSAANGLLVSASAKLLRRRGRRGPC